MFSCVCVYCVIQERVSNLLEMGVTGNHEPAPIGCSLQLPTQGRCVFKTFKLLLFFTIIKVSIFRTGVMAQKALTGKPNLSDSRNPHGGRTDFLKVVL